MLYNFKQLSIVLLFSIILVSMCKGMQDHFKHPLPSLKDRFEYVTADKKSRVSDSNSNELTRENIVFIKVGYKFLKSSPDTENIYNLKTAIEKYKKFTNPAITEELQEVDFDFLEKRIAEIEEKNNELERLLQEEKERKIKIQLARPEEEKKKKREEILNECYERLKRYIQSLKQTNINPFLRLPIPDDEFKKISTQAGLELINCYKSLKAEVLESKNPFIYDSLELSTATFQGTFTKWNKIIEDKQPKFILLSLIDENSTNISKACTALNLNLINLEQNPVNGKKEIEKAYRVKMKTAHPDKGGSQESSQEITNSRDLLLKYLESKIVNVSNG